MITITIPIIPSLFAILSFIMFIYMEIDESDRTIVFLLSAMCSLIAFFGSYGLFVMLGAI